MEDNREPKHDAAISDPTLRRFVYRSAAPDDLPSHPLRRATDTPRPFRALTGQIISPRAVLTKFRVYLKVN